MHLSENWFPSNFHLLVLNKPELCVWSLLLHTINLKEYLKMVTVSYLNLFFFKLSWRYPEFSSHMDMIWHSLQTFSHPHFWTHNKVFLLLNLLKYRGQNWTDYFRCGMTSHRIQWSYYLALVLVWMQLEICITFLAAVLPFDHIELMVNYSVASLSCELLNLMFLYFTCQLIHWKCRIFYRSLL